MANEIREGNALIRFDGDAATFYNPAQEFNRDLTVSVLRLLSKDFEVDQVATDGAKDSIDGPESKRVRRSATPGFRILDALSASGLRAVRFAREVPNVTELIANDFSTNAVATIKANIELNQVSNLVSASQADATQLMAEHRTLRQRFHAIDLDPYGTVAPFLDSAVQSIADRGLLMLTSTDMATLCGNTPEAALGKYGSTSFKHKSCHESAIRILLRAVQQHAAAYDRYIEPLLCVSVDFYVRCFVRVHTGAQKAKDGATRLSTVTYCTGCHSYALEPLLVKRVNGTSVKFMLPRRGANDLIDASGVCTHCGHTVQSAGPLYTAPFFCRDFVTKLLADVEQTPAAERLGTHDRIVGVLSVMLEELDDIPLYQTIDQLMNVCKVVIPKVERIRSALLNAGFRVSASHCAASALKTNAPTAFVWDIVRHFAVVQNKTAAALNVHAAGHKILSTASRHTIDTTHHPEALVHSRREGLLRFQDNRGKHHGPRAKAKGSSNSNKAATFCPTTFAQSKEPIKSME